MKREMIAPFMLFLVVIFSCSSEKSKNDLFKSALNGNVKSVAEIKTSVKIENGNLQKIKVSPKHSFKYNLKGNIIVEQYSKEGRVYSTRIYKYDNSGNLIEDMDSLFIKQEYKYSYDTSGKLTESFCFNIDRTPCGKFIHKYDENGNMDRVYNYDPDGNFYSKDLFKYDDEGRVIEKRNLSETDEFMYCFKTIYDKNGDEIEFYSVESDGTERQIRINKYESYDKNKNWLKKITYKNNTPTEITERVIEYY